ncbi:MAG: GlcNAc transferase, partial [Planctomycetales bacterium 12-60-4]
DHDFIEAWTQLGCVLTETEEFDAAREAFQIALDRHPEFPDAHFHLAQVLERLGDHAAALPHWRAYLTFDSHGPWADIARQHLTNPS